MNNRAALLSGDRSLTRGDPDFSNLPLGFNLDDDDLEANSESVDRSLNKMKHARNRVCVCVCTFKCDDSWEVFGVGFVS